MAKYRPGSRVPHDPPDAIPAFAAAFLTAILAPMLTQEVNTAQPGRMAQGGNNADKTMTASFDIRNSAFDIRPIRRALIEADLVDCMVALPGQLFYRTQIPACLWFLAKNKNAAAKRGFRDRRHLINASIAKA